MTVRCNQHARHVLSTRFTKRSDPSDLFRLVERLEGLFLLEHRIRRIAMPQDAVEVDVGWLSLQQAFVFEPLDVGQVTQGREPECPPARPPDARRREFLRVIRRTFSFENFTVGFDEPQGGVDVDVR